jgi:hypothetical protein
MTRSVNGHTLFRAREPLRRLSQRELARGVARRLGEPSRFRALQMTISRIEHKDDAVLASDLVDALEDELELERGDLSDAYRWVYRNTCRLGVEDSVAWLGRRLPVFTSAAKAYEARGWVTFGAGHVIPELEFAHPHEIFRAELDREIGGDSALASVDPPYAEFMQLANRPIAV